MCVLHIPSEARKFVFEFTGFIAFLQSDLALTDKVQPNRIAFNGLGRDLTVVQTSIPLLSKFDLQRPLVGLFVMRRCEPLVSRISVRSNG